MLTPTFFRGTPFAAALQQLRDGRPGESAYGRRIALLLTIPAFDDPVARDIRRSAATGEIYVVRTVWQRALDMPPSRARATGRASGLGVLELVAERRPSLWSTQLRVDPATLDRLLESVGSATIPCFPCQSPPPLDATVIELTFGDEMNETRYRWSGEPPEGWAPLATFATGLARLVDDPSCVTRR